MASGLREFAERDPEGLAVSDGTLALTRQELNQRVNRTTRLLRHRCGEPGSRVAILAANSTEFLGIAIAAAVGGMPLVPVNWHLSADEIAYILGASRARLLVADTAHRPLAEAALGPPARRHQ